MGVGGGVGPLGRNSLMAASLIGLHHPDLGQRQLDKASMSHGAVMLGDDEDPDRCVAVFNFNFLFFGFWKRQQSNTVGFFKVAGNTAACKVSI